jgi:hypothetical protein
MNPIEACINQMKEEAVARAVARGQQLVDAAKTVFDAAGGDLDKAAPYPKAMCRKAAYVQARNYRGFMSSLVKRSDSRRYNEPNICTWNPEGVARFLKDVAEDAAANFDAYVAKLTAKVGEVTEAKVVGMLWNHSILTVTKPDGSVENWKTQMILNISCLGKVFNQWPTRKQK